MMPDVNAKNPGSVPEKKTPWFLNRSAVIWGLLLVGPLALPLVIFSPKFTTRMKIAIIAVVAFLTYLSFLYTPKLVDTLMSRYESLAGSLKN